MATVLETPRRVAIRNPSGCPSDGWLSPNENLVCRYTSTPKWAARERSPLPAPLVTALSHSPPTALRRARAAPRALRSTTRCVRPDPVTERRHRAASTRPAIMWRVLCVAATAASLSQGQQDAIVKSVFEVIGTTNEYFVEIGFDASSYEGGTGANTWQFHLDGWDGVLIDGQHENASINLHKAHVTPGNVASLLRRFNVPDEPDYISLDVDTTDVWILEQILDTFRPRVVTVEYNSNFGDGEDSALAFPNTEWMPTGSRQIEWRYTCFMGSSAKAIQRAAKKRGYLVAGVVCGD